MLKIEKKPLKIALSSFATFVSQVLTCPVAHGHKNIAIPMLASHHNPQAPQQSLTDWLFGGSEEAAAAAATATQQLDQQQTETVEISGCEVQGQFYEKGAIVESSSGPCLQCRSDFY